MKFTTLVDNLKKAVMLAERITGRNLTLPILSNILITSDKNKIYISATDLELGIKLAVSGKMEEEGKIAIPVKTFSSFLNSLSEEKVILKEEKNTLKVKTDNYEADFQGVSADDFPIIPSIKTEKYIEIEKNILGKAIEQILPSISYNSTKPELNGVFIKLNKSGLELVGTDSFRLARKIINTNNIKTNIKDEISVIVPLRTMQELLRILQGDTEEESSLVRISSDPNQIQFSLEDIRLVSRLINAEYPKYSSIIPADFENKVLISKKELLEAVKVVGLFSGKINDTKFKIDPQKKEIIIEAQDPSLGKSHTTVHPQEVSGINLDISFNYRFLLDGLNSVGEETVFLGLNKEVNPGLLRGEKDNSFIYILMPIKI